MEGRNFVELIGFIQRPDFKIVGQKNTPLFKGSLAIPVGERQQYLKIAAWSNMAEGLRDVGENALVHIHGHIEERSYDGKCKACKASEKKYWTEVIVDNFVQLG